MVESFSVVDQSSGGLETFFRVRCDCCDADLTPGAGWDDPSYALESSGASVAPGLELCAPCAVPLWRYADVERRMLVRPLSEGQGALARIAALGFVRAHARQASLLNIGIIQT